MKQFVAAMALALGSAAALPAHADQKLLTADSEIAFTSKQMGVPVDGKFKTFDAQIAFDPKKPETAKIAISIDLASATLGAAETEAELAKPDWFSTRLFPRAKFESISVKPAGPGKFDVSGRLVIKGVSQNVVVPVTLAQTGADTAASGSFTIKRLDFKIGDGDWKDTSMVADAVLVRFRLRLSGVAAL